jgi:nucleoside-diphosphate-sugar epimerase
MASSTVSSASGQVLVLGATGATGCHVVEHLLSRGRNVRVIVRDRQKFSQLIKSPSTGGETSATRGELDIVEGALLDLPKSKVQEAVRATDGVVCCLGHTLTAKGIWGHPRRLCTDSVKSIVEALEAEAQSQNRKSPVKFVLMNSVGCPDYSAGSQEPKKIGWFHWFGLGALRGLVPPHPDNEGAAAFLRTKVGPQHDFIQYSIVRPDSLYNADTATPTVATPNPLSNPLSNPGKVSRFNVATFMADLITDDTLWAKWSGRSPVLYDADKLPKGTTAPLLS